MNRWVLLLFVAAVAATLLVGAWLRANYAPEWRPQNTPQGLRPFPVEADCYSQLARDQRILAGQGLIQNHFTVENWPKGLIPSTTAPFDYAILTLYAPLALFTHYPLDWAGALISPALWLAVVAFWVSYRSRVFQRAGRAMLIFCLTFIPALVWATSFGRPRHQSLIVALLAIALTAEYERWEKDARRGWHIAAGILWGLACWTSLFEPLFAIVVLVVFNLIVRRKESAAFGISFGVVMLVALLLEGVHVFIPPPEFRPVLERWLTFIAEMQGMSSTEMAMGLLITVPLIAIGGWLWMSTQGKPTDRLLIVLTIFLSIFSCFEKRWLYYACLTEVFLLARFIQTAPLHGSRLILTVYVFLDLSFDGLTQVASAYRLPPNQNSAEVAKIARSIDQPGGIMAPWWISPGLLYFSGQPIVSGSSHCGISGIASSAAFFATDSWTIANKILEIRRVRWVVVWDEPKYQYPLLASSQEILGLPVSTDQEPGDAESTVAQILVKDRNLPTNLQLRAVTDHFKLYEVIGGDGS